MEIEFFDPEKHGYFLEEYRKFSREPSEEEKEFFERLLEGLVDRILGVTGQDASFKLYFGMTDESQLEDNLPINRYVHGFSFAEWMEGFERNVIMIRAVRDREHWKDCLIDMLAHEMAHQEFYSCKEKAPYKNWYNLIFKGHAMNRAEQVVTEMGLDWKPHYRSDEQIKVSAKKVVSVLDQDRSHEPENIFQNGEKPCEQAEGYNIAYQIVKDIIRRTDLDLNSIIEVDEKLLRDEVERSVQRLLY